ncbi:HD domain-containing protein [Candidatus Nitronereus thalassa]|uniref:HD domain-containing protein n=1 Tax=Candidatus Nitronereus thalassa TaxID=3020898 RepID=A0ABU3K466_9BACT|nr:HD domain-containing protein [Candidatus Nitronereus thalassa]MDT7041173.1 HD domain-containing protein [Candidatus Nitronereus thalassa]
MSALSLSPRLLLSRTLTSSLLKLYDYPHPGSPHKIIKGYDKAHALRTAKMCMAVALSLHHDQNLVRHYQIACLLHDLGRAGLDQHLFGKIWSWAKTHRIPTRPAEWRAKHPDTPYGKEAEAFIRIYREQLQKEGIIIDKWASEQIEMRLGYARRMKRVLRWRKPQLRQLGISWHRWMEKVILYYYYPELMPQTPKWVKEFGEILVACEQLEAYSNRQRGKDYYTRSQESFKSAFEYLNSLQRKKQLSQKVVTAVRALTAQGHFDSILQAAKGAALTSNDLRFLRSLSS